MSIQHRPTSPRRGRLLLGVLTVALALGLTALPASSQDFSFTSITKGEFGGTLGTLMKLVPGAMDPIEEATYLKGSQIRTDDESGFTVMDGAEGRITQVNDEAQTYFSFTLEEMQARMEAYMAGAQAEMEEVPEEVPEAQEDPEVSFEVKLSTDRTGRSQDFGEYSAEQVLMIIEMIPRTEEARDAAEEGGSMVLFTELWLSTDFPAYEEYMAAQAELGEAFMGGAGADMAASFQQAFASDPRMQEAFEENMEAMKELDGMQVKSVSSFVVVPAGLSLDRDAILAATDQPLGEGVGSALGNAAEEGAKDAARNAVSGLTRGLFGRGKKEEEPEEPAPAQSILMRITSLVDGFSTGPLSDTLFVSPAGYTEDVPEWLRGGQN